MDIVIGLNCLVEVEEEVAVGQMLVAVGQILVAVELILVVVGHDVVQTLADVGQILVVAELKPAASSLSVVAYAA